MNKILLLTMELYVLVCEGQGEDSGLGLDEMK